MDELRSTVEKAVRSAFAGVVLGHGISLRQTQAIDVYSRGFTHEEFKALPNQEVTDDWSAVPLTEIERGCCVEYLDAEGVRYYLPALMLNLLDHYDDIELWVIGTIGILTQSDAPSREWLFSLFSEAQLAATAAFVDALPRLVDLDDDDTVTIKWAARDDWSRYRPSPGHP